MFPSKVPHRLRAWVGAVALVAVAAVAPAQTIDKDPEAKQQVLDRMTRLISRNAYVPGVDFKQWPEFLKKVQPDVDKAKSDEEFAMAVNKALHNFGFSHIALQTPREGNIFTTGTTVGIGITSQLTDEGVVVVRTVRGASADQAGIVPGDVIVEVEGEKPTGIARIVGAEGTEVHLKVKSKDGSVKNHTLVRRKFSTVRPEEIEWVDDDTARVSIFTFGPGYNAKRVESLVQQAGKAKNLILDLRDNGGGAVLNLQHMLGLFLPNDVEVGTFVNRDMVDAYKDAKDKSGDVLEIAKWSRGQDDYKYDQVRPGRSKIDRYTGRLVVLVNGGSGSASEIAAAALRDHRQAQIVGQKSAGAVLVSVIVPAGQGFMLQYPLSDYVTSSGIRLEGNGVKPDVESKEARVRLPGDPDEAVAKARELFAKAKSSGIGTR